MIQEWIAKLIGRKLAARLNLQEDAMETKPWYTSKTILANLVSFLIALYGLVGQYIAPSFALHLPAIPGILLTFLSGLGIYGRVTADTKIG